MILTKCEKYFVDYQALANYKLTRISQVYKSLIHKYLGVIRKLYI